MEELQHDPRTKQQIKELLYEFLYSPVEDSFKKKLHAIINKNTAINNYSHNSFMYRTVIYSIDNPKPGQQNKLSPQLQPAMNAYLSELKELNEQEMPYVLGYIQQVLNSSNELHDYLRLLPTSVHKPVQDLINTCPCKGKRLTDDTIEQFRKKNEAYLSMVRQRLVSNLLI